MVFIHTELLRKVANSLYLQNNKLISCRSLQKARTKCSTEMYLSPYWLAASIKHTDRSLFRGMQSLGTKD